MDCLLADILDPSKSITERVNQFLCQYNLMLPLQVIEGEVLRVVRQRRKGRTRRRRRSLRGRPKIK